MQPKNTREDYRIYAIESALFEVDIPRGSAFLQARINHSSDTPHFAGSSQQ